MTRARLVRPALGFLFVLGLPGLAAAKPAHHGKPIAAASKPTAARKAAPPKAAPARPVARDRPAPPPAPSSGDSPAGGGDDDKGTGETVSTTANGTRVKSKSYSFGAMDVEGKLKTPQLLYFLNRVKLELDMSAPDKRSFMKELGQSADDKNL